MKKMFVLVIALTMVFLFSGGAYAQSGSTLDDHNHYWVMKEAQISIQKAEIMKKEAELMKLKGQLMMKEGQMMVEHGKEGLASFAGTDDYNHRFLIKEGELMMRKAQEILDEAERLMQEAVRSEYTAKFLMEHAKEGTKRK
jgi:predicted RNA polymerase sigma factor